MKPENNFLKKHAKKLTLVITVFVLFGAYFPMSISVREGLSFSGATGALGAIFIVVLLVERVTEVLIGITRHEQSEVLKNDLQGLKQTDQTSPEIQEAELRLATYKTGTKQKALFISFVLSIIICVAGVGLLGEIFDITECRVHDGVKQACGSIGRWQSSYLRLIDIVLTAGLIAGGTEIFHQLFNMIGVFSGRMKASLTKDEKSPLKYNWSQKKVSRALKKIQP